MTKLARLHGALAICGFAGLAWTASAQTGPDTVATAPNVLLLVDTSASMEWKSSGAIDPVCDPANPNTSVNASNPPNEKSRWIELLEVLTGTINNYSCYPEKRDSSTNFATEFSLGVTAQELPRDLGDPEPYHRPLSNQCAPGAGDFPWWDATTDFWAFQGPTKVGVKYRPYVGTGIDLTSTCTNWNQLQDGLLDSYNGAIRFGLMTFDTDSDPGTGIVGGMANEANGLRGTWSYYLSAPNPPSTCQRPDTSGACNSRLTNGTVQTDPSGCCLGTPWDCTTPAPFEVGARNAAAPPWEGRMVSFGKSNGDGTAQNAWIQQVLLATRPFGATPIAGMLNDARDFLWYDTSTDPLPMNDNETFGPSGDPLVGKCRDNYIILLTDGEPNTDLRPACQNGTTDTACPYQTSDAIVNDLVTSTAKPKVRTFVVGFALGQVDTARPDGGTTTVDCSKMNIATDCNPMPTDRSLRSCCVLNQIAYNGTPIGLRGKTGEIDHAFFPRNAGELRTSLSTVFAVLFKKVAGRTFPVTAAAPASDSLNKGYEFTSGANVMTQGLWRGVLQRRRIVCDSQTPPQPQVVDPPNPTLGDDFVARLNGNPDVRQLFTVEAAADSANQRHPTWSMRPYIDVADGIGTYSGTQTPLTTPSNFASFPSGKPEDSLGVVGACGVAVSPNTCATRILQWASGLTSANPVSRCSQPGSPDCSVMGDIFHSVPQVLPGIPTDFLRDTTYSAFSTTLVKRDTMLYTSSNDGFFHGFVVAPGDKTVGPDPLSTKNNEKWAFVPPAVLPSFVTMYPFTAANVLNRVQALDGVPVIKDVIATKNGSRQLSSTVYPYRLERKSQPDTSSSPPEVHTWRTIVVQGFGSKRGGYFALDITNPAPSTTDPTMGPKFLWQLTTDDAGNPLFGSGSGTPLITTLFVDTKLTPSPKREVPVAVLPGGIGDPPQDAPAGCAAAGVPLLNTDGSIVPRTKVRCYPDAINSKFSTAARSLTIVRLDTGQVLRTFRPKGVTLPASFDVNTTTGVVTDYTLNSSDQRVDLDIPAPIVGTPVAYPSGTGLIADRIFVGDAEGRVWRIDVSDSDPAKWQMNVFFDPFYDQNQGTTPATPPSQPVQTPPVVSVDSRGQLTLAFATGDQETLSPGSTLKNYVVSVTETVDVATSGKRTFKVTENWRKILNSGERVMGPLTLFNRILYFSTFLQPSSVSCDTALQSSIWGMDYLLPNVAGTPDSGGLLATTFSPNPRTEDGLVAGVGLRQLPSCATVSALASSDDFLGYGQVSTISAAAPPQFELVIQKSGVSTTGSTKVQTDTVKLTPPITPVTVQAWAPMVE